MPPTPNSAMTMNQISITGPEAFAIVPRRPLNGEEAEQDRNRDWHDWKFERTSRDVEPFEGAQDRDGRRDDAVAIEEGRAEQAHHD